MSRSALARASVSSVLIAAAMSAVFAGCASRRPSAAPPRHSVHFGVGLSGGVPPRPVKLAALSAERLGVSMLPVTDPAGSPGGLEIPLSALIYDPQGRAWTYVVVGPDAYERVAITVDHIDGDHVLITSGPRAGTPVVTAGAPELLGVEYGVGEE